MDLAAFICASVSIGSLAHDEFWSPLNLEVNVAHKVCPDHGVAFPRSAVISSMVSTRLHLTCIVDVRAMVDKLTILGQQWGLWKSQDSYGQCPFAVTVVAS